MDSKRSLSEISHLFLSEVRERQSGGAPRPQRVPPRKTEDVSIDMSPEEFDAAFGEDLQVDPAESQAAPIAPARGASLKASVVLASHLAERSGEGIRKFARHLASEEGRVGLIEINAAEFTLTFFERDGGQPAVATIIQELDGRRMAETLAEMSFDVNRWLVFVPNPRATEARELIRNSRHWVLLTMAGDDGIVSTYRSLKGLSEVGTPRMALAVLDARDNEQAQAVLRKLDAVSRQFLGCGIESEIKVQSAQNVTEHPVLQCRAGDYVKLVDAPQWKIVSDFLAGAAVPEIETRLQTESGEPLMTNASLQAAAIAAPAPIQPQRPTLPRLASDDSATEVIDLPGDGTEGSILEAVIRQGGAAGQWVQCPLRAPMCPQSLLAVGRDQRLILLAVAGRGLAELKSIGLALRWMSENRDLIRMALPQLHIDAAAAPTVRLFVDHADLTADILQPLLQTSTVTVQAYRKLKWGQKTGLLLEAA